MIDTDTVEEDEPHWSEVLTDILLGFLAQPSQLWRTLSKQVYRHISSHLTNEALWLIIKVYTIIVIGYELCLYKNTVHGNYVFCIEVLHLE